MASYPRTGSNRIPRSARPRAPACGSGATHPRSLHHRRSTVAQHRHPAAKALRCDRQVAFRRITESELANPHPSLPNNCPFTGNFPFEIGNEPFIGPRDPLDRSGMNADGGTPKNGAPDREKYTCSTISAFPASFSSLLWCSSFLGAARSAR